VRPTSPFADQDVYVRIPHGTGRLFRILAVVFGRPATTSFLWVISTENPGQFTQVGSGREQRSEKPLLIEFDPRAGESRFASSRLPRPPGVFRGVAIHLATCRRRRRLLRAKSEFDFGAGIDLRVTCRGATSVDVSHFH